MSQYSIKDVEILSGVKAHTLRIWEQRYDFMKPNRTDTNIRFYNDEELKRILNVSLLNRNGFKISKIAGMSQDDINREVLTLSKESNTADNLLDGLIHAMLDFDEARFEKTLSSAILKLGIQHAFTNLVFPFMVRTGVLWATGTVRPAQEHFISNLVRRKLCVAIDSEYVEQNENTKKFVLFLPAGETHELLLLFTEYVLRKNNHHVAYLGNSVPFEDIAYIKDHLKPNYLVSYFTIPVQEAQLQEYVNRLASTFAEQKIFVSGMQLDIQTITMPANVKHIHSIDDLLAEL